MLELMWKACMYESVSAHAHSPIAAEVYLRKL